MTMGNIGMIVTFIAVLITGTSQAFRILVLVPIPSGSHAILGEACVRTLLDSGHEVVYVTAMPNRLQAHPKLVEVDISSNAKHFPSSQINLTFFLENPSIPVSIVNFLDQSNFYAIELVKHEAFQKVLANGKKFDVVIAEWMFSEIYAGLPALLDCPLIWFSSMEPHSMILNLIDEEPNSAYNADIGFKHAVPFTFFQRVEQLITRLFIKGYWAFYISSKETRDFNNLYEPMMKQLGKKLPSFDELRYNASLVLGNSHVSLGQPTRLPQNYISIGGYHIDPQTKPLSEDLKKIMDNATNGVIYFSMGSILKSKDFPKKLKMELLNMFGSLKQTVLWKFEEDFPNLPSNVHVLKWANQQSILNHPKCLLFISHGGLLSLTESVHYGVPLIGVPAFGDQFVNVVRAERKGFAKKVDLTYDLAKDLREAIDEFLGNSQSTVSEGVNSDDDYRKPDLARTRNGATIFVQFMQVFGLAYIGSNEQSKLYREKVKELSFVYHHRPTHPRKELVHWVEHVIKTRGAPILKSPALSVSLYQKLYLDLAVLILVLIYIVKYVVKLLLCMFSTRCTQKDNDFHAKKVQ